jgi:mono/diheme cytochrome c family protein
MKHVIKKKGPAKRVRWFALMIALGCWGASGASLADSDHSMVTLPKVYQAECAACHQAYPATLLGAPAWRRIMGGLTHHFGSDASIDEASFKAISTWLLAHASPRADLQNPPDDRITTSQWFARKHREIRPQDWAHPKVGSASNCMACHQGADRRGFDEDAVRLPVGVGRSRGWWRGGHE